MPDRIFVPRHDPPTRGDRIRAHRPEFCIAVLGLLAGAMFILAGMWPEFDPSPSIAHLPDWETGTLGGILFTGSVMRVRVTLRRYPDRRDYWARLRIAALLQMLAWACFLLATVALRPHGRITLMPWIPILMGALLSIMPAWDMIESIIEERNQREDGARGTPTPLAALMEVPPNDPH